MRTILLTILAACLLPLGGCVFWDIRDGVTKANARLDTVDAQLAATNTGLEGTNSKLEGTNAKLEEVYTQLKQVDVSLARLDATNRSLTNVEDRLMLLRSLDASLARVDVHLASLRKTISRIDGMIPFLDLGTEGEPEPTVPVAAAAPTAEPAAPADAGAPTTKDAAPARRDALLGVWVSQYPDRSTVIVLQEGGRYVRQRAAQGANAVPTVESGTWKRDAKRLELTGDPREVVRPDGTKAAQSTTLSWEIVNQGVKTLALRGETDGMIVLAKP